MEDIQDRLDLQTGGLYADLPRMLRTLVLLIRALPQQVLLASELKQEDVCGERLVQNVRDITRNVLPAHVMLAIEIYKDRAAFEVGDSALVSH